ncbi:MAG: hypothetical protein NTX79_04795 [Candidatus Micrarchaeota archaeon]|nr:hypothetical protein [Candidatus Micrarchaeota archaeon]
MISTSVSLPSGKPGSRAGNAFASQNPIGHADRSERRMLAGLKFPQYIGLIGGMHGKAPTQGEIRRLAQLREQEWNARHCESKSYEQHHADLLERFNTLSAPMLVARGTGGWIDASISPKFASRLPKDDKEILGDAYWNASEPEGRAFVARMAFYDHNYASQELNEKLMSEGWLPYARGLASIGKISEAVFYTWYLNGSFNSRLHQESAEMHLRLGALRARTFAEGRIEEMDYSHLLDGKQGLR